jgi:hypothetical protein
MSAGRVTFSTATSGPLVWYDGYEEIGKDELEQILFNTRMTLFSLEAEVVRRSQSRDNQKTPRLKRLNVKKPKDFDAQIKLDDMQIRRQVETKSAWLQDYRANHSTSRTRTRVYNAYSDFVRVVLQHAGPAVTLLVLCWFGTHEVTRLTTHDRILEAQYIIQNRTTLERPEFLHQANELKLRTKSLPVWL